MFRRGETPELALWPDLYPRLLRFLLSEDGRPWLAIPLQIVLLALAAWALMRFGEVALGDRRAAALAAALLLIDPGVAAFTHYLWPEILHLSCFLGALALLAAGARFDRACLAGALLAVAILAKSLLVPFLVVVAVVFWRAHAAESHARTAIFGLGCRTTPGSPAVGDLAMAFHRRGTAGQERVVQRLGRSQRSIAAQSRRRDRR